MSTRSPMQNYKAALKVWLLLCVLTFGGCSAGFYFDDPYTDKTSQSGTLELAYSSMQSCNKSKSCEVFTGRFNVNGKMYDRSIDGFFYHRFVDEGRKPLPAYITLSKNDMGVESPAWVRFLMFLGIPFALIFIVFGLGFLFGYDDAAEAQRKWEYNQKRQR